MLFVPADKSKYRYHEADYVYYHERVSEHIVHCNINHNIAPFPRAKSSSRLPYIWDHPSTNLFYLILQFVSITKMLTLYPFCHIIMSKRQSVDRRLCPQKFDLKRLNRHDLRVRRFFLLCYCCLFTH